MERKEMEKEMEKERAVSCNHFVLTDVDMLTAVSILWCLLTFDCSLMMHSDRAGYLVCPL